MPTSGEKYGEMCSNIAKSFNSWILDERKMPTYQMIDNIRVKLMEMSSDRQREAERWTSPICPTKDEEMMKMVEVGRHWNVCLSSEHIFEVRDEYSVMMDLQSHTCSCYQWQIKGFPCAHALAAILKDGGNPYDYVKDYFTTDFYKSSYSYPIILVPDIEKDEQSMSQEFVIEPPLTKRSPGRPKFKRLKSIGEETRPNKCSRCGDATRHNRKTCYAPI
ncbi:uncharacterized protein LOC126595385 [Malus sylvestris]|uniref:uncharacterized protein LOC126595385 n=1 Tax=Malus sylvestris TaxID=3752 RepID=UPI0021AD1EC0|nr:uncharacterized protein LOC126595385 [Malus sylvestris]